MAARRGECAARAGAERADRGDRCSTTRQKMALWFAASTPRTRRTGSGERDRSALEPAWLLDEPTALEHEPHSPQRGGIGERIAVHEKEIGGSTLPERAGVF